MKLLHGQIIQLSLRVMYSHAEIVSEAYKSRKLQRGCGKKEDGSILFRDCTDEEKLEHVMGTMNSHIRWVGECVELLEK